MTPLEVVAKAGAHRRDYLVANKQCTKSRQRARVQDGTRWRPPEMGRLKLNTDASIKVGFGASTAGVVRDDQGRPVWCFGERCECVDVEIAEALAIRRGVRYARESGIRDLIVESDAQTVIFALVQSRHDLSYLGNLISDILELAQGFDQVTYLWIRRDGKKVAHMLAFFALSRFAAFFFVRMPDFIVDTIDADRVAQQC